MLRNHCYFLNIFLILILSPILLNLSSCQSSSVIYFSISLLILCSIISLIASKHIPFWLRVFIKSMSTTFSIKYPEVAYIDLPIFNISFILRAKYVLQSFLFFILYYSIYRLSFAVISMIFSYVWAMLSQQGVYLYNASAN